MQKLFPFLLVYPGIVASKTWTHMFYLDAFDLTGGVACTRRALADTPYDKDHNIVLQIDNVERKFIERSMVTQDRLVTTSKFTPYATQFDIRNHEHIVNFCGWAINEHPAEHYALILGGHGHGMMREDFILPDKQFLLQRMYLKPALDQIIKNLGRKLDLIVFDSCCMGDIGTIDFCKDYCSYLIASEAVIGAVGLPYRKVFEHLYGTTSLLNLMNAILQNSGEESSMMDHVGTLAIINLSKTSELMVWFHDFFQLLTVAMRDAQIKVLVQKARYCSQSYEKKYVDLSNFLRNLCATFAIEYKNTDKRPPIFHVLMLYMSMGIYQISRMVEGIFPTFHAPHTNGISLFFPERRPEPFTPDLSKPWHLFLSMYYENV